MKLTYDLRLAFLANNDTLFKEEDMRRLPLSMMPPQRVTSSQPRDPCVVVFQFRKYQHWSQSANMANVLAHLARCLSIFQQLALKIVWYVKIWLSQPFFKSNFSNLAYWPYLTASAHNCHFLKATFYLIGNSSLKSLNLACHHHVVCSPTHLVINLIHE